MRKRKKYNPLKQVQLLASQSLKNSAIGCVIGQDGCQLIDLRSNTILPVSHNKVTLISSVRHQWSVFIAVFGIDHNNQHYMKSKEISVVNPAFQSDMVETLNSEHSQLIKEFNTSHLLSVGWLATPYLKDWSEENAFQVFEKLGALDFELNNDTSEMASS